MSSIYDLKVEAADGSFLNLSDYKGKVILVVNTKNWLWIYTTLCANRRDV